ncbi:aspartyl-phosphate phosphatase Spo0E family protein [Desulfitobacterium sp. Sab5]|uniref:aspartyl-phosphate phosphatase Spo0E family protein n=1 Tax=Desulfitobacterium TaxID=36853 RepID=UPI003CEC94AC
MKSGIEHLCQDIVEVHRNLIKLGKCKPPGDPDVVELNQRFKRLLNEYLRIAKQ